jgi:HD-like signal output (HDOD) protein
MNKKVVLIDDDDGLSSAEFLHALEATRLDLECVVASTGDEAIALLGSVDCLVAAVSTPSGNALPVLRHVADHHPAMGRLAVTRFPGLIRHETNHVLRPPYDADRLRRALLGATLIGDRITKERIDSLVAGAVRMPALPSVYMQLQDLLHSPDPSLHEVGEIIRTDPAISLKVIQTVNSALFGLRTPVADVAQASVLLGINRVSSLVLAVAVFREASHLDVKLIESMWRDAMAVSALAGAIAHAEGLMPQEVETAKLAGLLHDVGAIVLFQNWRDEYLSIEPDDEAEQALFGVSHSDIGGYLCALWHLADPVVEAVLHHHDPPPREVFDATAAVHVARALVSSSLAVERVRIHPEIGSRFASLEKLAGWASLAA